MNQDLRTKKALILETAREINAQNWTPAEIDQLRRRLLAEHNKNVVKYHRLMAGLSADPPPPPPPSPKKRRGKQHRGAAR